jgi:propanediol dehydratase small subunit
LTYQAFDFERTHLMKVIPDNTKLDIYEAAQKKEKGQKDNQ